MCWAGLLQHRCHLLGGAPFQPQLEIEPIQKRAGEPLPVALALADAAATALVAVAMPAAGAGIGGCHQGDQGQGSGPVFAADVRERLQPISD